MTIYCGREFSPADIQTINRLMQDDPRLRRTALSRMLCELFEWRKPNGELKDMTCRVALLRMQADGLITLPPSAQRSTSPRREPHCPPTAATDAQPPLLLPVHELAPLRLCPVTTPASSRLWNEYMARYHYLGYTPMSGSQMRWNVFAGEQLVALLSFGASAAEARRARALHWLERTPAAEESAARGQQRAIPDPALDPVQGAGLEDPVQDRSAVARRLASSLRLPTGAVRDLRRVATSPRHLLQGCQLDPRRSDHRPRKEVPRSPPDHPDQGHLVVPLAQGLRPRPLQIGRRLRVYRMFTVAETKLG